MQKLSLILIANQLNIITMKKYVVLKNYNSSNLLPDVVGQFDDCDDAKAFAVLNHMTDRDHNYTVAAVLGGTK